MPATNERRPEKVRRIEGDDEWLHPIRRLLQFVVPFLLIRSRHPKDYGAEFDFSAVGKVSWIGKVTWPVADHALPRATTDWKPMHFIE